MKRTSSTRGEEADSTGVLIGGLPSNGPVHAGPVGPCAARTDNACAAITGTAHIGPCAVVSKPFVAVNAGCCMDVVSKPFVAVNAGCCMDTNCGIPCTVG